MYCLKYFSSQVMVTKFGLNNLVVKETTEKFTFQVECTSSRCILTTAIQAFGV